VPIVRAQYVLVILACMGIAPSALAQVQRSGSGGGGANTQLYQQYQQAVTERTQLQADNAKLKSDLDDLKKQLAAAKQQLASTQTGAHRNDAALAAAQQQSEANGKALTDLKERMQELITKFRETIAQLQGVETERSQLKQELTASQTSFDKCAESNYSLYQVNGEVLDRYAHQGAFSYLARAEPFTQIKRTQIENLVLEYRERAEELRVKKREEAAPPSSPVRPLEPEPSSAPPPQPHL
jgi:chaperonin cofactor prefoldin